MSYKRYFNWSAKPNIKNVEKLKAFLKKQNKKK